MSWLTPLGFLGLIGLIIWLIIYLIKPNYQQKIISSSYVWIKSLKYRKKRLPINKLRNLLLILCQILTITGIALGMAQPIIEGFAAKGEERIIILDASADMFSALENGGENRFERAISQIHTLVDEATEKDGRVSVILASPEPTFLVQRAGADFVESIHEKLDLLKDADNYQCTYGVANVEGAMKLAETVLAENPEAQVMLYTGTTYIDAGDVTVVNVSDINEWNAAILKAEAERVEGYYEFRIDLASYGRDSSIEVFIDIYGANEGGTTVSLSETVLCTQEMGTVTLTFGHDNEKAESEQNYVQTDIASYEYAYIHIEMNDSLQADNTLYLYGGTKPELKIQYYTTRPNQFFGGALRSLRDILDDRWDINLTEVFKVYANQEVEPALEGFDVYIFEHEMPDEIPTDGLVILINPDKAPSNAGFYLGEPVKGLKGEESDPGEQLEAGEEISPLTNGMAIDHIRLTEYTQITMFDNEYLPLLYCGNDPVLLAKNEEGAKVVVMPFSLHFSNLPVLKEFPILLYNMLSHYVPCTVTDHLYEIGDTVELNARAKELELEGPGVKQVYTEFPTGLKVAAPGVYTLSQIPISGYQVFEYFYVKIPAGESNIKLVEDTLVNPFIDNSTEIEDVDLVFYFAMALVALLFVEWWLQSKEYF